MEIKRVTIGALEVPLKTGILEQGKSVYRLYRIPESVKIKMCLIEGDNAIDLNGFDKVYPILKRDYLGRLEPDQTINKDVLYALELENVTEKELKGYKKKIKEYKKNSH